jgi:hypothetical protein
MSVVWQNPLDGDNGIIAGHGRSRPASWAWSRCRASSSRISPRRNAGPTSSPTTNRHPHLRPTGSASPNPVSDRSKPSKLALNAGWDEELLTIELGELKLV